MSYVIVTGAATALGGAMIAELIQRGNRVAMLGRRSSALQALEARYGDRVQAVAAELFHLEEVELAFAAACEWGGLPKMVIHCPEGAEFGPLAHYSAEQVRSVLDKNLISTILVAQQTVRLLRNQGGIFATLLSSASQVGKANESLYCASMWGMRGFLESLRMELRDSPLRLVNLYPSGFHSELFPKGDHRCELAAEDAAGYIIDALTARPSCHVTDLYMGSNFCAI